MKRRRPNDKILNWVRSHRPCELSVLLDVSLRTISRWRVGEFYPNREMTTRIIKASRGQIKAEDFLFRSK